MDNSSLSNLESLFQFSEYLIETNQQECESIIQKLELEDSGAYCEVLDKQLYRDLLNQSLKNAIINTQESWNFTVNTIMVVIGSITNTISIAVFIFSKSQLSEMSNFFTYIHLYLL